MEDCNPSGGPGHERRGQPTQESAKVLSVQKFGV